MGTKGDRAATEPQAMRLYVDGHGIPEISRQLDVSETTLRRWKSDSGIPGEEVDGWDKTRQQKRSNIQRLKDLFERQLEYVEGLLPEEVTAPMMDTLSKLGALVERWDKVQAIIQKLVEVEKIAANESDGRVPLETLRKIRREIYGA